LFRRYTDREKLLESLTLTCSVTVLGQ
jgi:hypothetical protein